VDSTVELRTRAFDGGGLSVARMFLYDWGARTKPTPPLNYEEMRFSVTLEPPSGQGVVLAGEFIGSLDPAPLRDGPYLAVTEVTDRSGRSSFNYSKLIVDNTPPLVRVDSPLEGASVEGVFIPSITITETNLLDSYVTFNGARYGIGVPIDTNGLPEGAYTLAAAVIDVSGRSTIVVREVFIDDVPPRISVSSPGAGIVLADRLSVLATITDGSGIASAVLVIDGNDMVPGVRLGEGGLYSFDLDLALMNMSEHRFRIKARDRSGLVSLSEERVFYKVRHDTDGDGVVDMYDDDPLDPRVHGDIDGDGFGSLFDQDDDGDGVPDSFEPKGPSLFADGTPKGIDFRSDATEWMDTDGDGIGNNADLDDDGDNVTDASDAFPLNATEHLDTDRDGIGDNTDPDIDGDGVPNEKDRFPADVLEWSDTDRDGIGNNRDEDDDNDGLPDARDDFPLDRDRQYFWEPIVLILVITVACSMLIFVGMVFKDRIADGFDRSWAEGRLFRFRTWAEGKFSRDATSLEDGRNVARRGQVEPPRRSGQGSAKTSGARHQRPAQQRGQRKNQGGPGAGDDLQEFEDYHEEEVGSHKVKWSSRREA